MAKKKDAAQVERADNTLEMLGLSREEFREKVISQAVINLTGQYADPDEYSYMQSKVQERVSAAVVKAVDAYCHKHIDPLAKKLVTEMKFPRTNTYGEPKGEPETLLEYTARVAQGWLEEMVDHDGRGKREGANYSLTTARGVFLVHKHLRYEIQEKLTAAVAAANKSIASGIEASIKASLAEVLAKLKVEATTR